MSAPSKKAVYQAYGKGDLGTLLEACRTLAEKNLRQGVSGPDSIAALYLAEMGALEQEELRVVLLDTRNGVMGTETVYRGSLNASQVRIGEVFRYAIRQNAAAIIVMHNHPSGDPTPSPEDIAVTRAMVQAGQLLDIGVLDHIVIGRGRYVSLKSKGLGFSI